MKSNSKFNLLLNPFTKIAGWKATWIGLLALIIMGVLHIPFVYELHFITMFLLFFTIMLFDAVLMWVSSLILRTKARFIDLLGTSSLSSVPGVGVMLFSLLLYPFITAFSGGSQLLLICLLLVLITPFIAWSYILFFNGYKISTGLSGNKLVISFTTIIILSTITNIIITILYFLIEH